MENQRGRGGKWRRAAGALVGCVPQRGSGIYIYIYVSGVVVVANILLTVPYEYYVIEEDAIKDVRFPFLRSKVQRVWQDSSYQAHHQDGSCRARRYLGRATAAH